MVGKLSPVVIEKIMKSKKVLPHNIYQVKKKFQKNDEKVMVNLLN